MYLASGARAVSSCGDFLAATALVLELQQRGAGGFAVAAVLIAAAAPPVLLVRWTGRLADRADSRLLLVATGLAQAAVCVALAFVSGAAAIIALVAVLAAGLAVTQPCLSALLPSMVTADDLPRATALNQTASSLGMMLGARPGRGAHGSASGCGCHCWPTPGATWLSPRPALRSAPDCGATRAASSQPDPRGARPRQRPPGRWNRLARRQPARPGTGGGVRNDPLVRMAVGLVGAVVAAASLVNVAEVFFIRGTLHSTAGVYGLMESVWISAAVAGGWWVARRRPSDGGLAVLLLGSLALDLPGRGPDGGRAGRGLAGAGEPCSAAWATAA